jgi:ribonuclease HI
MKDQKKSFIPEAHLYCDGASSGNPGHAGIGVIVQVFGNSPAIHKISEYLGITTNNVAEYSAFIRGLEEAQSLGLKEIAIFLDSELIVRQIKGDYRVKSPQLVPLWEKSIQMLKVFEKYKINHMRRDLNRQADALAKKAIKQIKK